MSLSYHQDVLVTCRHKFPRKKTRISLCVILEYIKPVSIEEIMCFCGITIVGIEGWRRAKGLEIKSLK